VLGGDRVGGNNGGLGGSVERIACAPIGKLSFV